MSVRKLSGGHLPRHRSALRRPSQLDYFALRIAAVEPPTVKPECDHAERIEPVLVRRRPLQSDGPADGFPSLAVGAQPDDLAVDRIEPHRPAERLLHPADRGG